MANQETANAMLQRTANHFHLREFRHRGAWEGKIFGAALA